MLLMALLALGCSLTSPFFSQDNKVDLCILKTVQWVREAFNPLPSWGLGGVLTRLVLGKTYRGKAEEQPNPPMPEDVFAFLRCVAPAPALAIQLAVARGLEVRESWHAYNDRVLPSALVLW